MRSSLQHDRHRPHQKREIMCMGERTHQLLCSFANDITKPLDRERSETATDVCLGIRQMKEYSACS